MTDCLKSPLVAFQLPETQLNLIPDGFQPPSLSLQGLLVVSLLAYQWPVIMQPTVLHKKEASYLRPNRNPVTSCQRVYLPELVQYCSLEIF